MVKQASNACKLVMIYTAAKHAPDTVAQLGPQALQQHGQKGLCCLRTWSAHAQVKPQPIPSDAQGRALQMACRLTSIVVAVMLMFTLPDNVCSCGRASRAKIGICWGVDSRNPWLRACGASSSAAAARHRRDAAAGLHPARVIAAEGNTQMVQQCCDGM